MNSSAIKLSNSKNVPKSIGISSQAIMLTVILFILSLIAAYGLFLDFSYFQLTLYILFLISNVVTIYDTQCLVGGGCVVWSWIRTVLYCIIPIIIIIMFFINIHQKNKKEADTKQQE